MNRLLLSLGLLVMAACEPAEREMPAWVGDADAWPELRSTVPRDPEIETRIDQLMAEMSLEQKIGQMIQAEIRWVTPDQVRDYHIGSVLNGGGGFPNENKQSTVDDWLALADAFYEASMDTSEGRLPIPVLWGTDSVHGANNVIGATLFPHNIGLGAARNPGLVRRIGEVTAIETAVIGIPWTFAPTLAVVRDDRWGRTYEGYSEDAQIVRSYAAEIVEGLQGRPGSQEHFDDAHVLATAKHFLGDGGTEGGVDQGDNLATDEALFNVHGQGYVSALAAGVRVVMASYNRSRGHRMHGNHFLLTEMLKGKMSFDGFILGDWNGHSHLPGCSKKSCAAAINAGIDMVMAPDKWNSFYRNTLRQAKKGDIPIRRIDDAVRRILRVKFEAGLFDRGPPSSRAFAGRTEYLGSREHRALARQAVRESLVLLKNNDGLLPLRRDQSVLVAGRGANDIARQSGGWTLTWQGTDNTADDFPGATSIFDGISRAVSMAGGRAVLSEDGTYTDKPDIAIVVWGETPYAECTGDRQHLNFAVDDPDSVALLDKLRDEGIPVVSVFLSGRPLWVNPQLNASTAFVAAWLPGSEGAGIADVLFRNEAGAVNYDFKGKLSYSWPASADQLVLNVGDEQYEPLFPFGYGLTYADAANLSNQLPTAIGDERFGRKTRVKRTSCVEE